MTAAIDGRGLFQAILDDPADDISRLIYADWLDENGQEERAEFIRLQLKLADPANWPLQPYLAKVVENLIGAHKDQWFRLLSRKPGYGQSHRLRWWPVASNEEERLDRGSDCPVLSEAIEGVSRRGFLTEVYCCCADWMRWGPEIVRTAPIQRVVLSNKKPLLHPQVGRENPLFLWLDQDGDVFMDLAEFLPTELCKVVLQLANIPIDDAFNLPWAFVTEQLAIDALSATCIRWAKEQ